MQPQPGEQVADAKVLRPRLDAAGVDLGDVEQLGKQAVERVDAAVDAVDQLHRLVVAGLLAQRLGEQSQRVQRLAQVVAGGGEELRFGAVGQLGLAARRLGDRGFGAKLPGQALRIRSVNMDFRYGSSFGVKPPEAYERLLLDTMIGDATLFIRHDEAENSWMFFDPILDAWRNEPTRMVPQYPAGTWGPKEAELLLAKEGRQWRRL